MVVSISFRCIGVTKESERRVVSFIPNLKNQSLNDKIDKLKQSSNFDGIVDERYPLILIITNLLSQDAKNVCVIGNINIQSRLPPETVPFEVNIPEIKAEQKYEEILFDANGIDTPVVNIESVTYQVGNGLPTNQHRVAGPYLVDINEYRSPYRGFRDQAELETYYLLDTYTKEGYGIRGLMLNMLFELLAQVNTGKYKVGNEEFVLSSTKMAKIRSIIQIDIVSKIMMYIEDLVILLLSNKDLRRNYYDFLDMKDPDVGDRIGLFLDNLDTMSQEDLQAMMCYVDPASMTIEDTDKIILSKLIENNIKEIKSFLKWVKMFRETHAQIFRRYKHAGIPVRLGVKVNLAGSDSPYTNRGFDPYYAMILAGTDPLRDVTLLPYSDKIINTYKILLSSIQFFITDFLTNKIACINRRADRLIPDMYGNPGNFSSKEIETIKKISYQYYNKNPVRAQNHFLELNTRERVITNWYTELDAVLDEAHSKEMLQHRYGGSL